MGALFTLCSHAVVAAGGNLFWLLLAFTLACAASLLAARRLAPATAATPEVDSRAEVQDLPWLRLAGVVLGLAAVIVFSLLDAPLTLWIGGVTALLLGAASSARGTEAPVAASRAEAPLFAIGAICALVALVAHRPDAADALLANLAAAAGGHMDLPLLGSDTLHGRADLPLHDPLTRVESHALLVGAISWVTRIPPLYVLHWGIAAAGALLVPLAHAELFRRIAPRHWLLATGVSVVVLLCAGETERWYGNAAFLRIWQGDALFLFVFAPLLYVYAMRYAETPGADELWRLCCAQLAAIGCSGDALWIAPLLVLAGLLSALPTDRRGAQRLLGGLLPTLYGVAVAVLLDAWPSATSSAPAPLDTGLRLSATLAQVLGRDALGVACLAVMLTAWACCPAGASRRLAVAAPLLLLLVWLNPWLAEWTHAQLAGKDYALALLAVPIPVLATLAIVAPLRHERIPARAGLLATGVLAAVFALALPARFGPSPSNGVALARPGLKVPAEAHRWAASVNQYAAGGRVVAPPDVSTWIPTFRDAAHPLMVAPYLEAQRERVGHTAYRDRYVMTHFAGGELRHPEAPALFARGLELYGVDAACIRVSEHAEQTRGILRRAGYERRLQSPDYEIWVKG